MCTSGTTGQHVYFLDCRLVNLSKILSLAFGSPFRVYCVQNNRLQPLILTTVPIHGLTQMNNVTQFTLKGQLRLPVVEFPVRIGQVTFPTLMTTTTSATTRFVGIQTTNQPAGVIQPQLERGGTFVMSAERQRTVLLNPLHHHDHAVTCVQTPLWMEVTTKVR